MPMNIVVAVLAGCGSAEPRVPTPLSDPLPPGPTCRMELQYSSPRAGDVDVYRGSYVELEFLEVDPSISVSVSGIAGTGEWLADPQGWLADTYRWTPESYMEPGALQSVEISLCDGQVSEAFTFRTSPAGLGPVGGLGGRVYQVDPASGTWLATFGAGPMFFGELDRPLLLAFQDSAEGLFVHFARAAEGLQQDLCAPTASTMAMVFDTNPEFRTPGVSYQEPTPFGSVDMDEVVLSGTFLPSGERIEGLQLELMWDTRSFGDICSEPTIACEPCSDGVEACIPELGIGFVAHEVFDVSVVPRSLDDIEEDCD